MTSSSIPWPPDGGTPPTENGWLTDVEYWEGDEYEWDTCQLGDIILPGHASVSVSVSRKLDVKSAPGSDGATITDKGYDPARITIKLVMWLAGHKDQLKKALVYLHPRKKGKTRTAFEIHHAATNILGIKKVYVEKISGLAPGSIVGTKEITLQCVEWTAQSDQKKNVTTTPQKAVGNTNTDNDYFSPRGGTTNFQTPWNPIAAANAMKNP